MSKTYKIKCFDKISACGLKQLDDAYTFTENFSEADAALVRSSSLHETEAENSLLAVARAGAGVNNIPLEKFSDRGIVVFNTPGANANGVKETRHRRAAAFQQGYRRGNPLDRDS